MKKNLHVFDIDADNLKSFTTTEKDFNRKVDRFPPITFRNVSNDILDENFNEHDQKVLTHPLTYLRFSFTHSLTNSPRNYLN